MANTFGQLFRIDLGESMAAAWAWWWMAVHRGSADEADIQPDLDRRRPGNRRSSVRARSETKSRSCPERSKAKPWHADLDVGQKRGCPPGSLHGNGHKVRPSHADYTYQANLASGAAGGGRTSARETYERLAGAIAKKILRDDGVEVLVMYAVQRIQARSIRQLRMPNFAW